MESLSNKEFFEKLKTNHLKPAFALMGIIKKSDKDQEVMFTSKHDFHHWIAIPSSMIESVKVIKSFSSAEVNYTLVKLHLVPPTNPEAKTLFDLLTLLVPKKMCHEGGSGGMNKSHGMEHGHCGEGKSMHGMEHGDYEKHCHCECGMMHHESHCHCGCGCLHRHCGCGCACRQQHSGFGGGGEKHFGCH
jgi:hypothetical protein